MALDLKKEVNNILQSHIGDTNPITGKAIASKFGFKDDRAIRIVIRQLIADGMPIVSRTEFPAGYFIAETYQQLMNYANSERSRIIENALRIRDLKHGFSNYWNQNKQTRLI